MDFGMPVSLLPTWKEPAWFWHLVPHFPLRTDLPEYCRDTKDHARHDGCVRLPIMRLSVPTTLFRD